jgi:hypothetical protein
MEKELSINDYCDRNIKRCSAHLEYLRELIDITDGMADIAVTLRENDIFTDQVKIINFNSLITISDLESTIILKNIIKTNSESEKKYFIKLTNLIIYETINSYNKYSKEIREITKYNDLLVSKLNITNKSIKEFKKVHDFDTTISKVRNKTIGHIDKDYKLYYSLVSNIKFTKSLKMLGDFINLLDEIMEFCADLLQLTNNTDVGNIDVDESYEKLKNIIVKHQNNNKE